MTTMGEKITALVATSQKQDGESRIVYLEAKGAYAKGFLAVHKITEKMSEAHTGKWRITHTATGYLVRVYDDRKMALIVRDALVDSDIDWEFINAKAITREVAEQVKEIEETVLNAQPLEDAIDQTEDERIAELEEEGMTHSDAQAVYDAGDKGVIGTPSTELPDPTSIEDEDATNPYPDGIPDPENIVERENAGEFEDDDILDPEEDDFEGFEDILDGLEDTDEI